MFLGIDMKMFIIKRNEDLKQHTKLPEPFDKHGLDINVIEEVQSHYNGVWNKTDRQFDDRPVEIGKTGYLGAKVWANLYKIIRSHICRWIILILAVNKYPMRHKQINKMN